MPGYQYQLWNEPEPVLQAMDSLGISKAVIFPFPFPEIDILKANNFILECSKSFSGRFFPVGLIHPGVVNEGNNTSFLGYKQHCVYQTFSPEELIETYQLMAARGQILYIHLPFQNKASYVQKIIDIVPTLKIVVAHMGRRWPDSSIGAIEVLNRLKKYQNIIFETSTIGDKSFLIKALKVIGEKRICFGSDTPFGEGNQQTIIYKELESILSTSLTPKQKENILGNNIADFFNG